MIIDDDVPRVRTRARAPLLPRRHRRARRRRAARSWKAMYTAARHRAHARDARLADARPHVGVHDAGRGPAAGHEPHRPRPARARRVRLPGRARDLRRAPRTRSSRRATTRPKLEAVMREAGAEYTFAATSPPLEGDRAGPRSASMSRHIMGTCRMGDDPATSVVDRVAALPRRREHGVHRLVGVPDVDRLRPDAHDRRARDPRRAAISPACRS